MSNKAAEKRYREAIDQLFLHIEILARWGRNLPTEEDLEFVLAALDRPDVQAVLAQLNEKG